MGIVLLRQGGCSKDHGGWRGRGTGAWSFWPTTGRSLVLPSSFSVFAHSFFFSFFVFLLFVPPCSRVLFVVHSTPRKRCRDTVVLYHGIPWHTSANRTKPCHSVSVAPVRNLARWWSVVLIARSRLSLSFTDDVPQSPDRTVFSVRVLYTSSYRTLAPFSYD